MSTALYFVIGIIIGNVLGGLLYAVSAGWDGRRFVFAFLAGMLVSAVVGLMLRAVAA